MQTRTWGGNALLLAAGVAIAASSATALAQTTSAKDLRTQCILDGIPALPAISATWTGTCVEGRAAGFGEIYGFSAGQIRYILRGHFNAGRLDQQDELRDCSKANCADDVARSVLQLHEKHAAQTAASPAASASPAVAATFASPSAVVSSPPSPSSVVTTAPLNPPPAIVPVAPTSSASAPADTATPEREIRVSNATYRGRFISAPPNGVISGEGRVVFDDGANFEGRIVNGRKHGRGTYTWPDGLSYSGDWVEDQQTGKGTLKFKNGDIYEGDVVRGVFEGKGAYTQASGDTYTGDWVLGKRDGRGTSQKTHGQRYEGEWKADRRHGQGSENFPDGSRYEGQWQADRAVGVGDIVFASGDAYTGAVVNGIPQGEGIYRWGSGDRFDGEFTNGKPVMERGKMTFFLDVALASTKLEEIKAAPPEPPPTPTAAQPIAQAAPTREVLCAKAYNAANTQIALRRFLENYPDDECGRHAIAKQKIAAILERERIASRAADERMAIAKTFVGAKVAFLQDFPFCVVGTGSSCQRVTYSFNVRAQIRDLDIQRRTAQVQVIGIDSLGQQASVQNPLFAQGRTLATEAFRARTVGSTQTRTFDELGVAFSGL
jgi:hypothetical protein